MGKLTVYSIANELSTYIWSRTCNNSVQAHVRTFMSTRFYTEYTRTNSYTSWSDSSTLLIFLSHISSHATTWSDNGTPLYSNFLAQSGLDGKLSYRLASACFNTKIVKEWLTLNTKGNVGEFPIHTVHTALNSWGCPQFMFRALVRAWNSSCVHLICPYQYYLISWLQIRLGQVTRVSPPHENLISFNS